VSAPHGTYPRYRDHIRDGERADPACLAANRWRETTRVKRSSARCWRGLGWPLADPALAAITARTP
jgi:hypothetical protein